MAVVVWAKIQCRNLSSGSRLIFETANHCGVYLSWFSIQLDKSNEWLHTAYALRVSTCNKKPSGHIRYLRLVESIPGYTSLLYLSILPVKSRDLDKVDAFKLFFIRTSPKVIRDINLKSRFRIGLKLFETLNVHFLERKWLVDISRQRQENCSLVK